MHVTTNGFCLIIDDCVYMTTNGFCLIIDDCVYDHFVQDLWVASELIFLCLKTKDWVV